MNSSGYRFAASDNAFYIPAVVRHLEPAAFPRDAPLIDSQARITFVDDEVAAIVRATGASLPHAFIVLYGVSMVLLFAAIIRLGRRMYRGGWAVVALTAAMTLRHSIAKTGANTLEAYFHPRILAFALGLLGVSAFLDRRDWIWITLLAIAMTIHPTTGMWFCVWLGVAAWFGRPRWRKWLALVAVIGACGVAFMLWRGPLAGHLVRMDSEWLTAIIDKDYLFPFSWPISAWVVNLLYVPVIVWCWRLRRRADLTVLGETPLVIGAVGLLVLFVCWLPFNAMHVAVAVELQLSRIFWLLDVFATVYAVWWLVEGFQGRSPKSQLPTPKSQMVVACIIAALSLARGTYSLFIQFPDRRLFDVDIKTGDWADAMAWARTTDLSSGWLADPIHAARYGSSIRAVAHRDVLLERIKDRALAMYDRSVALRVNDRERALQVLQWDTPDGARALARRYDLDYLIIDRELDLPLAHRSGSLFIYRLR